MAQFGNLSTFLQCLTGRTVCTLSITSSMTTLFQLAKMMKMEVKYISTPLSTPPANHLSMDLTTPQRNMSEVCMF